VKIAIIGSSGNMGRWFASFLLKDGKEVVILGRNESKLMEVKQRLGVEVATSVEAVSGADVILLSVPIGSFEEVVKQVQPYVQPRQVVVDITSVKVLPVEIMHKYIKAGAVLGTHPVFGPGARGVKNQNFVLTPTNNDEETLAERVTQYLEARGARVTIMTPQEHDEMMAVVLGLAHFISIVSADTLAGFDKLPLMREISGSTYKVLLTLVESVISEDPELYASLQMNLPKMAEIEELFQRSSKTWAELIKNKDSREFVRRMNLLKERLEKGNPDFGKSYENMYRILEGL